MTVMSVLEKPTKKGCEDGCDEERSPVLWSREDAQRLADMGLIPERFELIEGVIYEKMGQKPPHRRVLRTINKWLQSVFGYDYVMDQQPVFLKLPHPNDGDLEPDITVLARPEQDFAASDATSADIALLVEISYTTLTEDITRKAAIYAQNGIAEYWIADVKRRQIIVHREPTAEGYHQIKIYTASEMVAPLVRPNASVTVGDIVPEIETATE